MTVGIGNNVDKISIENILLLIPGLAFTNSLRDMFSRDTITGLVKLSESVFLDMAIATGLWDFPYFLMYGEKYWYGHPWEDFYPGECIWQQG